MARLRPYEVLENRSFKNHSRLEVMAMLEHYGFIASHKGDGHIQFRHREYEDMRYTIPWSSGDINATYVEGAAELCMEVKRRNQELRSGESLEPIPDWVKVPGKFEREEEDNELWLTSAEKDQPEREYRVIHKKGEGGRDFLEVVNINYPNDCRFTFSLNGNRRPQQGFFEQFKRMDNEVWQWLTGEEKEFNELVGRLCGNRGFVIEKDDPAATEMPMMRFLHPACGLAYEIPLHVPNAPIANETLETLKKALNEHEEKIYFPQLDFLWGLETRGWQAERVRASNGHAGEMKFSREGFGSFSVPSYGELEIFDVTDVKTQIVRAERARSRVQKPAGTEKLKGGQGPSTGPAR